MSSVDWRYRKRQVKFFILFIFVKILIVFVKLFRREYLMHISEKWGRRVFNIAKKGRQNTIANLTKAYGETKSEQEIKEIAIQVFINLAKVFIDYAYTTRVTKKNEYLKYVQIVGEEHLKKAYDKGKGVLCLIPHLSSWEFAAITPPLLGYETSAASKEIRSPYLNKMMVNFREKRGMKNISRDNSYAKLVDVLRKGECMIIMIDQDTRVRGVYVDFYGKEAYTPIGVTRLAKDTGAAIVPMAMTRKDDNNYCFTILPEEPLIETGDEEKDMLVNTQRHTELMEKFIRKNPDQWVWIHDRWRTTPLLLEAHLAIKRKKKQEAQQQQR